MISTCSDEEIEEVIEVYSNTVYRFALSLTRQKDVAEDVFQNVFLRYMKKRPQFKNEEHAKAWFYVVTRNCSRMHFTSAFMRYTAPLLDDIPSLTSEEKGLYYDVLKLPEKYRTVIHLFYYEGYSTQQISSLLNKKDATVRTRLRRARELLKIEITRSEENENL